MRLRRTRVEGALSLIEGSLAIGLIGTFLAVFLPTFFREMHTSKIAEATEMMGEIAARAGAYYNTSQETSRGARRRCLPESAGPTPELPSEEPVAVDFTLPPVVPDPEESTEVAETGVESWVALGVSTTRELRFSYQFHPSRSGCGVMAQEGEPLFRVQALGDLDGDGELSTFEQGYRVRRGNVEPFGVLHIQSRVE